MISQTTGKAVLEVLLNHMPAPTLRIVLADLARVPGNASYRASIAGLRQLLEEHRG